MRPPATPLRLIRAISSKSAPLASRPETALALDRFNTSPTVILPGEAASAIPAPMQQRTPSAATHFMRHPFLIATLMFYHYPET